MFSGLMKLAESAEPMKIFAEATDLAADAISRLASALVAFDADTFDKFINVTASEDFTQLQENLNNSGLIASAVFATQLEEAVGAEVTRQIAADTGAAGAGGPVVIQNSAAPQVNNFSVNSSLQPTSTDLELMKIIGHGNILQ
jgi:predicted chitinase